MSPTAKFIKDCEINPNSISLYVDQDTEFGTCDVTGEDGELVRCSALTNDGQFIEFEALDSLVGGELGKLAGAF